MEKPLEPPRKRLPSRYPLRAKLFGRSRALTKAMGTATRAAAGLPLRTQLFSGTHAGADGRDAATGAVGVTGYLRSRLFGQPRARTRGHDAANMAASGPEPRERDFLGVPPRDRADMAMPCQWRLSAMDSRKKAAHRSASARQAILRASEIGLPLREKVLDKDPRFC
jgi:hypothetical protein